MRKLIAAMKRSVDGRSEAPDGYADWVDACLYGGRMYPGYEQ